MEDAHISELNINGDPNKPISLFSVFDGHGGIFFLFYFIIFIALKMINKYYF